MQAERTAKSDEVTRLEEIKVHPASLTGINLIGAGMEPST